MSDAVVISASEMPTDKVLSISDVKHSDEDEKLAGRCDYVDTAVSQSSASSSYSVVTLKESPDKMIMLDGLSCHPETVSVSAPQALDSSEKHGPLNSSGCLPSNTSTSSAHALSNITAPPVAVTIADNLLTDQYIIGLVKGVAIFVDHLERIATLRSKAKLNITEHTADVHYFSPFLFLPAIVESGRSDEGQFTDTSAASGNGYVADGGLLRSDSCHSSASSTTGFLHNVAEGSDVTHASDGTRSSVTSASACSEQPPQSFTVSALSTSVTGCGRQLSTKSSSDGIDSAVVCTPYSSQTSRDSSNTVDNTQSSFFCRSVSDTVDDQPLQPLPSAADEMRPVRWENNEVRHATVNGTADEDVGHESFRRDSEDEMSISSLKVEWEIGSDIEETKQSEGSVPLIESSAPFVQQPFLNTVSSVQSLVDESQELDRHWTDEPVARRACCACISCVIMRHCVSTAADVTPTISVRMCSSVVDVVCLLQRLIVTCSTWLQVLCDSAFHLQRFCHSRDNQFNEDTAPMRPTSADHAACYTEVVHNDITDSSVGADLQYYSISEGLKNIRESLLQQLIDVSNIQ